LDWIEQQKNTHLSFAVDYETAYCHLGHPSKEALRCARENTTNFPEVKILSNDLICPGCALGKMPNRPFPPFKHQAIQPFQLIHLDLKTFPTLSYYKQKYMITFYDDFTSHTWISALTTKDKALQAIRHFIAYVENQYHATVQMWMLDTGEEYRSNAFDKVLKNRGIRIFQSTSHTSAEYLGRAANVNSVQ